MPMWGDRTDVVRIVEGVRGRVAMRMELVLRFGYGNVIPWVRRVDGVLLATGGPHSAEVRAGVETHGEDFRTVAEFTVGTRRARAVRDHVLPFARVAAVADRSVCRPRGDHSIGGTNGARSARTKAAGAMPSLRSLITLKSLTHAPTGGIVAAPTTSLPERIGGTAQLGLPLLLGARFDVHALCAAARGLSGEAAAWRDWLLRSAAGRPERSADAVRRRRRSRSRGIRGAVAARIRRLGAGADRQCRVDPASARRLWRVDRCPLSRPRGRARTERAMRGVSRSRIVKFLETHWNKPDHGIWETRGEKRHFTHSKVMAWVAFDRAISDIEKYGLRGPGRALAQAARAHPRRHLRKASIARATRSSSTTAPPKSMRACS